MSDPLDGTTPSGDEVGRDPETLDDPGQLQSAPDLDEDQLGVDPLEEGVEPPERWSEVSETRPTPREQREGETVEERLSEERADTRLADPTPMAETRVYELDESADQRAAGQAADEGVSNDETVGDEHGTVLEGSQVEPTGLSAVTEEGAAGEEPSGVAPEEAAERVDDSGSA